MKPKKLTEDLFLFGLQSLFDPLPCLRRESSLGKNLFLARVLPRGRLEETDLLSVAAAPFAEHQVNPQTKPLTEGKLAIKRGGLQANGLFAAGR